MKAACVRDTKGLFFALTNFWNKKNHWAQRPKARRCFGLEIPLCGYVHAYKPWPLKLNNHYSYRNLTENLCAICYYLQNLKNQGSRVQNHWVAPRATQSFILPRSLKWVPGIPGHLVVKINCLLDVTLALRQLNPNHKKGPWNFLKWYQIAQSITIHDDFRRNTWESNIKEKTILKPNYCELTIVRHS